MFSKGLFPRRVRRQFQIERKWKKVIQTGRKHCGKRRNCSLRAISPFPTVFSKGLFPRGVKRCHCVGMANKEISHALLKGGYCSEKKVLTHVTLCCLCRKARIYHNFFNVLLFLSHSKLALLFMCLQYKSFENTVGKGNIAIMSNFSQFPQFFLKLLRNFLPFFEIVVCKVF